MPRGSRPDLLPLAFPTEIGLPYHGALVNGKLILPGGSTIDHAQPIGGDTNLVRHLLSTPVSRTPTEQEFDNSKHYNWKDYAVVYGNLGSIGGQDLPGGTSCYRWIYCDSKYSWAISAAWQATSSSLTVEIWLEKPFGIFGSRTDLSMSRRLLTTYSFDYKKYDGTANTGGVFSRLYVTSSATGNISAINVKLLGTYDYAQTLYIAHSFKVTISGDGSLDEGIIGSGISAVCAVLADADDMVVTNTTSSGKKPTAPTFEGWLGLDPVLPEWVENPVPECPPSSVTFDYYYSSDFTFLPGETPSGAAVATTTTERNFFYCVATGGTIINIKIIESTTTSDSLDTTIVNLPQDVTYWSDAYIEFGGACQVISAGCYDQGIDGVPFYVQTTTSYSTSSTLDFSFGDFSRSYSGSSLVESWTRRTWSPEYSGCNYWSYEYIDTNGSTNSSTPIPGLSLQLKTNNVIAVSSGGEALYVSIGNNTETITNSYVTWNAGSGEFYQSDNDCCWV